MLDTWVAGQSMGSIPALCTTSSVRDTVGSMCLATTSIEDVLELDVGFAQ